MRKYLAKKYPFMAFLLIGIATIAIIFTFGTTITQITNEDVRLFIEEIITMEDLSGTDYIETDATVLYLLLNDWIGGVRILFDMAEDGEGLEILLTDSRDTEFQEAKTLRTTHDSIKLYLQTTASDDHISTAIDFRGIETLICFLGAGNDNCLLRPAGGAETTFHAHIFGEAGNDTIDGGGWLYFSGHNTFNGGPENDHITASFFQDNTLIGGPGDDTLEGFAGNDTLLGNEGDDTCTGDAYSGGGGKDLIDGGDGYDVIDGGYLNDTLNGGSGNDTIYGGSGDDTLDGGLDNDYLYGNIDNDVLLGREGDDRLFGEAGRDILNGGPGIDRLRGGAGTDTLVSDSADTVVRQN